MKPLAECAVEVLTTADGRAKTAISRQHAQNWFTARKAGYHSMRLDTIGGQMQEARALYDSLGFRETAPYYRNPHPGADYLALDLTPAERD